VVDALDVSVVIISFNNEGFVARDQMEALLLERGRVDVQSKDYKRYVGAQIGIHNLKGQLVGKVKSLRNKEYLYTLWKKGG